MEVAVAAVVMRAGAVIHFFEARRPLQLTRHPHDAIILQPNLAILLLISLHQLPVAILFRSRGVVAPGLGPGLRGFLERHEVESNLILKIKYINNPVQAL